MIKILGYTRKFGVPLSYFSSSFDIVDSHDPFWSLPLSCVKTTSRRPNNIDLETPEPRYCAVVAMLKPPCKS